MAPIIRVLPVSIITIFMAYSADAAFRPYRAPELPDQHRCVRSARGSSAGGQGVYAFPGSGRGISPTFQLNKHYSPDTGLLQSGAVTGRSSPRGTSFAIRHVWDSAVPSHLRSHYRPAPLDASAAISLAKGSHAYDGKAFHIGRFNQSGPVTLASIGSLVQEAYNGHILSHKVLGYRHRLLSGPGFHKPGSQLYSRLARLRDRRWHRPFKHVVISGFAGAVACDLYCEFDVPDDIYGDFVAAAREVDADGTETAEFAEDETALADFPQAELMRRRIAKAHGWNKAVAILEASAAEDDKKAAAAKNARGQGEVIFDEPDERIDFDPECARKKCGRFFR